MRSYGVSCPPTTGCKCKMCCNFGKKPKKLYCQPPIPHSYKPLRVYSLPKDPFEDSTSYNLSYLPYNFDVRRKPIVPQRKNNISDTTDKFYDDTVYKLTYLPTGIEKRQAIRPPAHVIHSTGPMQDLTSYKHDYVPKDFGIREQFRPFQNLCTSEKPLDDGTTYDLSYPRPGYYKSVEGCCSECTHGCNEEISDH